MSNFTECFLSDWILPDNIFIQQGCESIDEDLNILVDSTPDTLIDNNGDALSTLII